MKNNVSKIVGCALLLLTLPAAVQAQFTYTVNNGTVTITGYTGPTNNPVTIPDTINGLPVTSIGAHSFDNSYYKYILTNLIIPDSVTNIGDYAFSYCYTLNRVTIGTHVISIGSNAFNCCFYLTNATIPNNVASIGDGGFDGCSRLTSVTVPDSVTHIGISAFGGCYSVSAITVDPSNSIYCSVDGVLFNKNQTTLIQTPAGRAGNYIVPDSVTSIGDSAFRDSSLTGITIPSNVISIGNYAFAYGNLTNIMIGTNVASIGEDVFFWCTKLTNVTIPESVTNLGSFAFHNCYTLATVAIGNNVTSIGDWTFANCTSLINVTIGNRVTSIGNGAFDGCGSLTNITIPNSVTSIGEWAFEFCTSLTSVTIGTGIASIDGWAFQDCTSLTDVFFQGDAPTFVACSLYWIFSGGSYPTIYYVAGTAGWSDTWQNRPAVAITTAPIIASPPANQSAGTGYPAAFTARTVGSNPLIYQWRFNGTNLTDGGRVSGSTSANLNISHAQFSDAGNYDLIVTNAYGSVTSSVVTLTVTLCPVITLNPATLPDVTLLSGYTNTLAAQGGTPPYAIVVTDGNLPPGLSLQSNGLLSGTATNFDVYHFIITATDAYGCSGSINYTLNVTGAGGRLLIFTNGVGSLMATPSKSGNPTNNAALRPGTNYNISAVVPGGCLFSNWVAVVPGVTNYTSSSTKLSFTFQSNLTLIANFVTNQFLGAAGAYHGLFCKTNEVTPQTAGFFKVTTTSRTGKPGSYSGSLTLAGETVRFSGSFDVAGNVTLPLSFNFASVTLQLHLAADGSDTVTGTVGNNDGSWAAKLDGNRAVFKASNPATAYAGQYTLAIPGSTDAAAAPEGDGYGTVTVAANGTIKLSGSLGDGAVLSQSVPVSKHGDWPFYRAASAATGTNAAAIMGWLSLSNGLNGTISWIKSPVDGDVFYSQGFTNETDILASRYTAPAANNRAINLNNGTGIALLEGGNLGQCVSNQVCLSSLNKFTTGTNCGLTLTVAPKTGLLKGSFIHPVNGGKAKPYGVVLQEQNTGRGYFKGTNQTGALLLQGN